MILAQNWTKKNSQNNRYIARLRNLYIFVKLKYDNPSQFKSFLDKFHQHESRVPSK